MDISIEKRLIGLLDELEIRTERKVLARAQNVTNREFKARVDAVLATRTKIHQLLKEA